MRYKLIRRIAALAAGLLAGVTSLLAQPANDNCAAAETITIPGGGYGYGTFAGSTVSLASATNQVGETFPAGVPNGKSVWYKFSIPTTRQVRIILSQSGTPVMNPDDAGWTLYKTNTCIPGAASVVNPPIQNIEGFTHECLRKGDYLIQVGAKLAAGGNITITLEVTAPDPTKVDAIYDHAKTPYDFEVVSGTSLLPARLNKFYDVGCQSIWNGEPTCSNPLWTKSTWHIFSTDAVVDYFRFEVGENPFSASVPGARIWGYNLYQGDIRTDSTGLPLVDACKSLTQTSATSYGVSFNTCDLLPNTTYSIQLLHPTEYFARINTRVYEIGAGVTASPSAAPVPASHSFGVLASGVPESVTDYFSCNGLMSRNNCGTIVPDSFLIGGTYYDMNIWVTFEVGFDGNVNFDFNMLDCGPNPLIRIYNGYPSLSGCNIPLDTMFTGDFLYACMPAGKYSMQILGRIEESTLFSNPCSSNLSDRVSATVTLNAPAAQLFGLHVPAEINTINGMTALSSAVNYPSTLDYLDCRTTYMPAGSPCAASNNRAIYRRFVLGQPGTLTITGGNPFLQYAVFQGDASTAPISGGLITGLTNVSGCQGPNFQLCLLAGTYTLVSMGGNDDVTRSDNPTIRFNRLEEDFGLWTPADFNYLNGGVNLVSGVTYNATRDTFDCRITKMPVFSCGGDRAMYREFNIPATGLVTLGGGTWPHFSYKLYYGGADTASVVGGIIQNLVPVSPCHDLYFSTWSDCLPAGRYTLVTFGDAADNGLTDRPWVRYKVYNEIFGLHTPAEFNNLNGGAPLVSGTTYTAISDTFDCRTTKLPAAGCGGDRAMYREFTINNYGTLTVNASWMYAYRLYRGGADTAAVSGSTILNLVPVTGCTGSTFTICIEPGRYTLVTFGSEGNVGMADQPSVRFDLIAAMLFGLFTPAEKDNINGGAALVSGTTYASTFDRFECRSTILPQGDKCGAGNDRAIYRRIVIGTDGILVVGGGDWMRFSYRLYRGDASTAPIVGGEISGLVDQAGCQSTYYPFKVCVTPGIYTLVTFGDPSDLLFGDSPWLHFQSFPPTAFTNPLFPNMVGSLSVSNPTDSATPTRFNCTDNPLTILGYTPCSGATKQIYREFHLDKSYYVFFGDRSSAWYTPFSGIQHRLFKGRISVSSGPTALSALVRNCWSGDFEQCLDSGWYTVVTYGFGETFPSPEYPSGYGGSVGEETWFTLALDVNLQKYGTFATAEDVNGGNPIRWNGNGAHTAAIPKTDTTYILGTEYWDCANNLPFPAGITACAGAPFNRVSYRVIELSKPSYVYITNLNPWPYGYQSRLYAGDITALAPPFPVAHECIRDELRACLAPGKYTLVTFASDAHIRHSHTPHIRLDSLGTSKFNYAKNAYDFGNIPNTGIEYFQNLSHAPDALGRPQSNDFFFCSTDAALTDTIHVCPTGDPPPPFALPDPTNPRRNLWYTFTLSGGGTAHVKVYTLTPTRPEVSPFAVYKSNTLVIPPVDSTTAMGLSFVGGTSYWWCYNTNEVIFTRDNCIAGTDRYYIMVDNHPSNEPNTQIQVSVEYEPSAGAAVKYDHYSQANPIVSMPAGACAPPYTPFTITSGTYEGCMADLTCATKDPTDQNICGTHTVWYKFDVGISGRIRMHWDDPFGVKKWNDDDMQLYRSVVPGDSSSSGLMKVHLFDVNATNPGYNPGVYYDWGQGCVAPGTYYLMFTGCSNSTETVVPRIWIDPVEGDFCSDSIRVVIPDTGYYEAIGRADCWTIGEAAGEDGSDMGCLGGPSGIKSGWFYINITDTAKMDLDIELEEYTSASGLQLKYRVGVGSCATMTYDECVDEGTFIILNLRCRQDSGLWVQVILPENDTGTVKLKITATESPDTACIPRDPFAPTANFSYTGACEGDPVAFHNSSTLGTGVTYLWNFGDGYTSTMANPTHTYTSPPTGTFTVTLIVDNGYATDTAQLLVTIYPKPSPSFTWAPAPVYAGAPVVFTSTSTATIPGATYYWNFCASGVGCVATPPTSVGPVPPPVVFAAPGLYTVCLTITNGTCDSTTCMDVLVELVNIYTGGPYDGHDDSLNSACVFANIFTGGPYDGHDMGDYTATCGVMTSIWQGGPYDGHAMADSLICVPPPTIWAGGPYDGHASASLSGCTVANIFTGGPYDGFDDADSSACILANIFTGGPYDGFDVESRNSTSANWDTICRGSSTTLIASSPTNWWTAQTGGTLLASGTSTYTTPGLNQAVVYWIDNTCYGGARTPVQVVVLDTLVTDFVFSPDTVCVGDPVFFSNQSLIPGPPTPSFGTDILSFGIPSTGAPPLPQRLTLSGAVMNNFAMMWNGVHDGGAAWTGNNAVAGTMWAQWMYLTPKSVSRFYYWNNPAPGASASSPTMVRLYYSTGGPWILLSAWFPAAPSSGTFDTGFIDPSVGVFAQRWKIEFDVPAANGPQFGEFQVFASDPVTGGAVSWDFADGSPSSSVTNPAHIYSLPGTYEVELTASWPGACPGTHKETVVVEDCGLLPVPENHLTAAFNESGEHVDLLWRVNGSFDRASFQRYSSGGWITVSAPFDGMSDTLYPGIDTDPVYNSENTYRVQFTDVNGNVSYSNLATVQASRASEDYLVVFPNPVAGTDATLELDLAVSRMVQVEVYSMFGQQVLSAFKGKLDAGTNRVPLEVQQLAHGTYLVRVILDGQPTVLKLIKAE